MGQENTNYGVAPVQIQIDELKQDYARLRAELQEIKKLLEERPVPVQLPARITTPPPVSINVRGEIFRGDTNARVAIMEYSDFNCSFCQRYAREVYPQIDQAYIQMGRIKYFFRDLPGFGDTNSCLKARAARCAGEQQKFWEMHDLLFAMKDDPNRGNWISCAQGLGLDLQKFSACLDEDRYTENIRLSVRGAKMMGIHGTPAFVIGTLSPDGGFLQSTNVLVGGESFAPIKAAVDFLLEAQSTTVSQP